MFFRRRPCPRCAAWSGSLAGAGGVEHAVAPREPAGHRDEGNSDGERADQDADVGLERYGLSRFRRLTGALEVLGAVGLAAPQLVPASALGRGNGTPPSERIRLGLIGAGGRGRGVMGTFKKLGTPCIAVCDVNEANLKEGILDAGIDARIQ